MADFSIRVYYEDTDCGGIVYHTNYLKYCERARSEAFFGAGALPNTARIGLVVRSVRAEFLDSARLGDLLIVQSEILKLGRSSVVLSQKIFLHEKVVFTCEVKLACVELARKKIVTIPSEIRAILEARF